MICRRVERPGSQPLQQCLLNLLQWWTVAAPPATIYRRVITGVGDSLTFPRSCVEPKTGQVLLIARIFVFWVPTAASKSYPNDICTGSSHVTFTSREITHTQRELRTKPFEDRPKRYEVGCTLGVTGCFKNYILILSCNHHRSNLSAPCGSELLSEQTHSGTSNPRNQPTP